MPGRPSEQVGDQRRGPRGAVGLLGIHATVAISRRSSPSRRYPPDEL